jgi:hypothetical protein
MKYTEWCENDFTIHAQARRAVERRVREEDLARAVEVLRPRFV